MKTPAIQNDFSYYRRTVSRQRLDYNNQSLISTELANRMSLFYAHASKLNDKELERNKCKKASKKLRHQKNVKSFFTKSFKSFFKCSLKFIFLILAPMLKVLSEATSKFVQDNANDVDNTTETIGTMAKVCLRMLEKE